MKRDPLWYMYNYPNNSAMMSLQILTDTVEVHLREGTIRTYCKEVLINNHNPVLIHTIKNILQRLSPENAEWLEKIIALS